jgi:hypothetical protein
MGTLRESWPAPVMTMIAKMAASTAVMMAATTAPALTPTMGSFGGDYLCLINLFFLYLSFSACLSRTCPTINVFLLCVC